ncbi:cyclic nucleotide-binding domain-containing protein [Flavobacteriaceae bacterium Ap0902]|nr:cyclic nucleotide-binding domain-containing protein [Flavobacteriaceae bacterium Ap0902]
MSENVNDFTSLYRYFQDPESLKLFTTEELNALESENKVIELNKGDYILEEGHASNGVYLVTHGTAKLFKVGFTGKEQIIRFLKKGDLIGYRSILSGQPFGATATALEPMTLEFIPERFFLKMLQHNSKMSFEMLKMISKQLGDAADTITILAQKTVRERLAEILIMLEETLGIDDEGYIRISLRREEMANLIGTATESAIRLISEFKTDELIEVKGRKIKILEHQRIRKLGHVDA